MPRNTGALRPRMESLRQDLLALHAGACGADGRPVPLPPWANGLEHLSPEGLGWTQRELRAYLAGVIDSDGNLRVEKKQVRDMIGPHDRINIRCAQVIPSPAVELLARTFSGSLSLKKSGSPNHRDLIAWSLRDRSAVPALKALLPYLRVKRNQAHLLLELRRLKTGSKQGLTEWVHKNRWQRPILMRKRCYTPAQVAEFERIRMAVQALHAAGTGAAPGKGQSDRT